MSSGVRTATSRVTSTGGSFAQMARSLASNSSSISGLALRSAWVQVTAPSHTPGVEIALVTGKRS